MFSREQKMAKEDACIISAAVRFNANLGKYSTKACLRKRTLTKTQWHRVVPSPDRAGHARDVGISLECKTIYYLAKVRKFKSFVMYGNKS